MLATRHHATMQLCHTPTWALAHAVHRESAMTIAHTTLRFAHIVGAHVCVWMWMYVYVCLDLCSVTSRSGKWVWQYCAIRFCHFPLLCGKTNWACVEIPQRSRHNTVCHSIIVVVVVVTFHTINYERETTVTEVVLAIVGLLVCGWVFGCEVRK